MPEHQKMGPSPGRQLLIVALILALCAVVVFLATACGLYPAIVGAVESGEEAAQATRDAALQAKDTLHSLEHLIFLIPAYIAGEARRPLWAKMKNRRESKKAAKKK